MRKLSGIYKIVCRDNSMFYIGKSSNILMRFSNHISRLKNNKHDNSSIQNCYNKYGEGSLDFQILVYCIDPYMTELEQKLIDFFWEDDLFLNQNKSSSSPPISKSRYWLGKHLSDETKRKISLANINRKLPQEAIEKTRQFHLGRKRSQETCSNISLKKSKKSIMLVSPNKERVLVTHIKKFCQEYNLTPSAIYRLANNQTKTHKGWTI